jgi:uncharacterized membrane protein YkvA (DUF1232 family)
MDKSGRHARRFSEWTEALPADARVVLDLMNNEKVAMQGRRMLTGALNYLLTQLDIIPDHEQAGAVDDAMVLRMACALASEHAADLKVDDATRIGRLANDEDTLKQFFGDALYAKFRRYVLDLADKEVRGRTTDRILGDARMRSDLAREVEQGVKKVKVAHVDDDAQAEALEVSVRSYFKMKLGG